MQFNCYMPTKVIFGAGRLGELANLEMPGKKALILITCGNSMRRLGYLNRVQELLSANGIDSVVFGKILPNPIEQHVLEAASLARKEKCDFIIGLGGGSAIDSAKATAVMVNNGEHTYWDYIKGKAEIKNKVLPIIAIPTTAGTGTETDPWTVITNTDTNEKIGFGNDQTFPLFSIVDPELTVSVPAKFTAYQGMDALFHSIEGYLSLKAQPISDLFALDSILRIATFLPKAVQNGEDLQAREQVLWASTQGGIVESLSSCISEHSLEHALSAFFPELPHGAGLVALSVPYFSKVLELNRDRVAKRYMNMAKAMGEAGVGPEDFITALKKLIKSVGLDSLALSSWGILPDDAEKLAENSFLAMGGLYNMDPVRLTKKDAVEILKNAIF